MAGVARRPVAAGLPGICPPSFRSTAIAEAGAPHRLVRPVPFDAVPGETLPAWGDELPRRPIVYVTLGALDNDAPGVFEAALEGVREEPVNVVLTIGPGREPHELGPPPPNAHVERYVPQSLLLPRCDVVVTHGGSGTTLAALGHGLPLLVLPRGANQFSNADRCVALGVGLRLLPDEVDAASIRHGVRDLLDQPRYRQRAVAMAGEIARMPPPAAAVPFLERLGDQKG